MSAMCVVTSQALEIAKQADDNEKDAEEEEEETQPPQALAGFGADVKGIPQFWACAMGHVDVIAELITECEYTNCIILHIFLKYEYIFCHGFNFLI